MLERPAFETNDAAMQSMNVAGSVSIAPMGSQYGECQAAAQSLCENEHLTGGTRFLTSGHIQPYARTPAQSIGVDHGAKPLGLVGP